MKTVRNARMTTKTRSMSKGLSLGVVLLLASATGFPDDFTDIEQNIKPGTIVIIGETHQEPESPRFFKRLVDSTIAKYQCLSIGLEIERSQQATIDDVMAGRAPVSKIRIPFAVDHDGMRRMIEQFAELKRQSPCLKVEAIDADQDRDENMANRLADFPSDQPILVLLGGLHALKKVNWTVTSGKPAVAEILVHRGFQVKSYPQRWLPETCPADQGRTSRFISATQPEALPILNRTLMSLIKAKKHRTANDVIDGLVIWRCKGEKT